MRGAAERGDCPAKTFSQLKYVIGGSVALDGIAGSNSNATTSSSKFLVAVIGISLIHMAIHISGRTPYL